VPELRGLQRERSTFGTRDGETTGAHADGPGAEPRSRALSRFGRALARTPMGRSQVGEQAK
jgi:hypothetical protein